MGREVEDYVALWIRAVVHTYFLIGFTNRLFVLLQWGFRSSRSAAECEYCR